MKRYSVTFTVTVKLDIAEDLIEEVMKPDWTSVFYKLETPEDVASHLAYNLARNHAELTSLDGFAHRSKDDLKLVEEAWNEDDAEEIKS